MNLLLLKSGSGNAELIDFLNVVLGKFSVIEIKEVNASNVYISLSQYDPSYNKEGGDYAE
jgi:hypothetical protein